MSFNKVEANNSNSVGQASQGSSSNNIGNPKVSGLSFTHLSPQIQLPKNPKISEDTAEQFSKKAEGYAELAQRFQSWIKRMENPHASDIDI